MTDQLQPYLLTFNPAQSDLSTVKAEIDKIAEVENWSEMFGSAMVLISGLDAQQVGDLVKAALPGKQFVLTKMERGARSGWLPRNLWTFINEPHAA